MRYTSKISHLCHYFIIVIQAFFMRFKVHSIGSCLRKHRMCDE